MEVTEPQQLSPEVLENTTLQLGCRVWRRILAAELKTSSGINISTRAGGWELHAVAFQVAVMYQYFCPHSV